MDDEELSLDEFDIDAELESDPELDAASLSSFGEVQETFDVPHIKFATKGFINILREFKQVCATAGRDVISKSFLIKAGNGKIIFKATDFDTYFETELECQNTENVCEDDIVVPLDIVIKMVGNLAASTVILKRDDAYFMHFGGGDMVLETYKVDTTKFTCADEFEDVGVIAAPLLSSIIRDMGVLATAANVVTDRRVVFGPQGAVAAYTYSIIKSAGDFPAFDLKIKDLKVLAVACASSDEVLKVKQSVNAKAKRVAIVGEKFKYQFLVTDTGPKEKLVTTCDTVSSKGGLYIDFLQLSRLVKLAAELPYSVGKVNLSYDNNDVKLEIQTKKQQSSIFTLAGSKEGELESLSKPLIVQAKLFYILLRSFAHESSIKVILTKDGIGVKCDKYSSLLLVE